MALRTPFSNPELADGDLALADRDPALANGDLAPTSLLVALIAVGVGLRLWGLGSQLVLQDEVHTLDAVLFRDYRWILTHFGAFDHCIPLTLYAKLLAQTVGLSEWSLRLPGALAGCLTTIAVGLGAWRWLRPTEAVLCTAGFALSPYLVYLSREARPYPIVLLLFTLCWGAAFYWLRGGGRAWLFAASLAAALSVYFHPVVLPSAAGLGLYLLWSSLRAGQGPRTRDCLWAGAIFLLLCGLLCGPATADLLSHRDWRSGQGAFDLSSLRAGLMLLHGFAIDPPLLLWLALGLAGIARLSVRHPRETFCLSLLACLQLAVVWLEQPVMAEQTFVWFRYVAHLLPFLLAIFSAPFAWGIDRIATSLQRKRAGPMVAGVVALLFIGLHWTADRYALGARHANAMHPWFIYLQPSGEDGTLLSPSGFYQQLADVSHLGAAQANPRGELIEAPLVTLFPLYGLYQRSHQRPLRSGVTGSGFRQKLFAAGTGLDFARTVDLDRLARDPAPTADLLIWHKQIREELYLAMQQAYAQWPARLHSPPPRRFREFSQHEFQGGEPALPPAIRERFELIYDDAYISVFDLQKSKS